MPEGWWPTASGFRLVSRRGTVEPDVVLAGPAETVVAVLLGRISPEQGRLAGVEMVGPGRPPGRPPAPGESPDRAATGAGGPLVSG